MLLSVSQTMAAALYKDGSLRQWHSSHQGLRWYIGGAMRGWAASHNTINKWKAVQSREARKNRLRAVPEGARTKTFSFHEMMHHFPLSSPQHCLFLTWSHVCVLAEMCKLPHYLPSTYTGQPAGCSAIRWKKRETASGQQGRTGICVLGPGSLHFEQPQLTVSHAVISKVLAQSRRAKMKYRLQGLSKAYTLITPT